MLSIKHIAVVFFALHIGAPVFCAEPNSAPVVTRFVKIFRDLESNLHEAVRTRDSAVIEKILGHDFEMRIGAAPGQPVPRIDWMHSALAQPPFASSVHDMSAHEHGDMVNVSFSWKIDAPKSSGLPKQIFVVDTWVKDGDDWKLAVRYASAAAASASASGMLMPGYKADPAPTIRKKY